MQVKARFWEETLKGGCLVATATKLKLFDMDSEVKAAYDVYATREVGPRISYIEFVVEGMIFSGLVKQLAMLYTESQLAMEDSIKKQYEMLRSLHVYLSAGVPAAHVGKPAKERVKAAATFTQLGLKSGKPKSPCQITFASLRHEPHFNPCRAPFSNSDLLTARF